VREARLGRFDSVSLGGTAIFGALSVILTTLSQALGLNFPIIPYLQFDFGEIAIFLSFFVLGPVPAIISSIIEFAVLMVIGQNVPVGPVLKLIAILSSLGGLWLGMALMLRIRSATLTKASISGIVGGAIVRIAVMTAANYYLIVFLFTLSGIVGFLTATFRVIGVTLTDANALGLILGATAVFNGLQLLMASLISFLIVRLPQVQNAKAAGRPLWIVTYLRRST
jgi:riboflavin transporter FmnP